MGAIGEANRRRGSTFMVGQDWVYADGTSGERALESTRTRPQGAPTQHHIGGGRGSFYFASAAHKSWTVGRSERGRQSSEGSGLGPLGLKA
jgi:hypothetical protein